MCYTGFVMREIRFFLLLFLLQYYVAPCYAKCAYGIKQEEWPAGTTEEQFIVDGWLSVVGDGQDYLQCEGPGDPFVYCVKGSRVLGADGNIHECNNKKWTQIPPEDIPTCTQSLAVLNDTLEGNWLYAIDNKLPYIYFRDHEYFMKISTVCKYETRKFIDQADECLLKGGDFLPVLSEGQDTICDTSDTYDLHITVTDSHNNNLSDVSVEFANLYDQNNSRNVATVADNGEYLVPTTKYRRGTDLIISKSGYIPQTIQIRKLEENPKVILQSETPEAGETETEPTALTQPPTTTTTAPQGSNTNQGQTVGKDRLTQAQENLKLAKDTEQSFANRMLGGATTAATGLGLMTAASAYSEKQADEAAEQDMSAYLATFRCEYGKGQSSKAGNEEITLPGGNELLGYYSEYKSLADNLKNTKKALGMRPGIEQEVVYDKAESGLYKYASTGITDGAFTSLSRALTDPEGKDAAEWNAQKEKTAKNLKTGLIAAGAGVVGGIAGDMLINGKKSGGDGTGLGDILDGVRNTDGIGGGLGTALGGAMGTLTNPEGEETETDEEITETNEEVTEPEAGEEVVNAENGRPGRNPGGQVSAVIAYPWTWFFASMESTEFDAPIRTVKSKSKVTGEETTSEKTVEDTVNGDVTQVVKFLKEDTTNAKMQCITVNSNPAGFAEILAKRYEQDLPELVPDIKYEIRVNQSPRYKCDRSAESCQDIVTTIHNRPCGDGD